MRSTIRVAALAATVAMSASCSEQGLDDAFIFISNTWEEVGNPDHRFSLESGDDGAMTGTFTGTEFVDAADQLGNPLSGSWASSRIQFTVTRHAGSTTYSGEFVSDTDQLNLQSSQGALTIRRQQQ